MYPFYGTITNMKMFEEVKKLCANRFETKRNPCKDCPYRNRWREEDDFQTCIFDNCPRDWEINQNT